jgi:hypothetical protein
MFSYTLLCNHSCRHYFHEEPRLHPYVVSHQSNNRIYSQQNSKNPLRHVAIIIRHLHFFLGMLNCPAPHPPCHQQPPPVRLQKSKFSTFSQGFWRGVSDHRQKPFYEFNHRNGTKWIKHRDSTSFNQHRKKKACHCSSRLENLRIYTASQGLYRLEPPNPDPAKSPEKRFNQSSAIKSTNHHGGGHRRSSTLTEALRHCVTAIAAGVLISKPCWPGRNMQKRI